MTIPHNIEIDHEYAVIDVDGSTETLNNAIVWCTERFGPSGHRWFYTFKRFYFREEKDSLWFELRW